MVRIDAALGSFWDDIGRLIELSGDQDSSGGRRHVAQLIGLRRDDEAQRYLKCSAEDIEDVKAKMIAVMGPIPEALT